MKDKCPECEYHKARAANWRAETYKLAGYDYIPRVWVGLTDEDVAQFETWYDEEEERKGWVHPKLVANYFEAKLKEKNT